MAELVLASSDLQPVSQWSSGYLGVQSANWTRQPRYSGAVRLEALGYGNPFFEALYPIRCQGSPKK
ncbi:hypothetical protein [Streptosporangium fragile]|uniref:hypothetical protein n=1 Tax=Streptosporangium fragile TaxID=46186 RepID=UPI0031E514F5